MLSRNGLIVLGLAAVSSLALTVVPSHAHHSRVNFSDEIVAFQATVTRFEWANPHVYVYVEAPNENGVMTEWEIETQSTPNLIRRGWTRDSLRVGDIVTVRANPDRNPEKNLLFGVAFTVERYTLSDDGTTVTIDYVIEAPEYLTEPVSGTINWRHAPHLALLPYDCDPAVSRRGAFL